jgi:hypothetical protein
MPISVRVCGALNGSVSLPAGDFDSCTLGDLRAEVARLLAPPEDAADADAPPPPPPKLILAGRVLQDGARTLSDMRVGPSSRVLVSRAPPAAATPAPTSALPPEARALSAAEQRAARLERLRACAARMAGRDALRTDGYSFELENQRGERLALDPSERAALATALALHAKGKATLLEAERGAAAAGAVGGGAAAAAGATAAATEPPPPPLPPTHLYSRALDELLLADEAFALAPPRLVELTDNRSLLQLDAAWAALRLRDASRLGVWLSRLERAREGLRRAHGERGERAARLLDGGGVAGGGRGGDASAPSSAAAAAVRCRLDVLSAAALFHRNQEGDLAQARQCLRDARGVLDRLAALAPDDRIAAVSAAMACDPSAARTALRRSAGDAAMAVDWLQRERERRRARRDERRRRSAWRQERARYGKTNGGEYVDGEALEKLLALGGGQWARAEVADALRSSENDRERALAALTSPEALAQLQMAAVAREQRQQREFGGGGGDGGRGAAAAAVDGEALALLVACGFKAEAARAALLRCGGRDAEAAAADLAARGRSRRQQEGGGEGGGREAEEEVLVAEGGGGGGGGGDGGDNKQERLERAAEDARRAARDLRRRRKRAAAGGGGGGGDDGEEEEETDEEAEGELSAALRSGGQGGDGAYDVDDDQERALAEVLGEYEALVLTAVSAARAEVAMAAGAGAGAGASGGGGGGGGGGA